MTVPVVVRLGQLEEGGVAISTLLGAWDRMVSSMLPLRGDWTRHPVGQMASPQPEGDLRDHTAQVNKAGGMPQNATPCPP